MERISNIGTVLLKVGDRKTLVQQVLPMEPAPLADLEGGTKHEAGWLTLGKPHVAEGGAGAPELEPGESESFEHDFLIDDEADVVQVYSHFKNPRRRRRLGNFWKSDPRGWTITTVHDLSRADVTHNTSGAERKEP